MKLKTKQAKFITSVILFLSHAVAWAGPQDTSPSKITKEDLAREISYLVGLQYDNDYLEMIDPGAKQVLRDFETKQVPMSYWVSKDYYLAGLKMAVYQDGDFLLNWLINFSPWFSPNEPTGSQIIPGKGLAQKIMEALQSFRAKDLTKQGPLTIKIYPFLANKTGQVVDLVASTWMQFNITTGEPIDKALERIMRDQAYLISRASTKLSAYTFNPSKPLEIAKNRVRHRLLGGGLSLDCPSCKTALKATDFCMRPPISYAADQKGIKGFQFFLDRADEVNDYGQIFRQTSPNDITTRPLANVIDSVRYALDYDEEYRSIPSFSTWQLMDIDISGLTPSRSSTWYPKNEADTTYFDWKETKCTLTISDKVYFQSSHPDGISYGTHEEGAQVIPVWKILTDEVIEDILKKIDKNRLDPDAEAYFSCEVHANPTMNYTIYFAESRAGDLHERLPEAQNKIIVKFMKPTGGHSLVYSLDEAFGDNSRQLPDDSTYYAPCMVNASDSDSSSKQSLYLLHSTACPSCGELVYITDIRFKDYTAQATQSMPESLKPYQEYLPKTKAR